MAIASFGRLVVIFYIALLLKITFAFHRSLCLLQRFAGLYVLFFQRCRPLLPLQPRLFLFLLLTQNNRSFSQVLQLRLPLGNLFGRKQSNRAQQCLQLLNLILYAIVSLADATTNLLVYLRSRYLLQNGTLLFGAALDELGELALCQHHRAAKLVERQAYALYDGLFHILVDDLSRGVGQRPFHRTHIAVAATVGASKSPFCLILAVVQHEREAHIALCRAAAHQLARVVQADAASLFLFGGGLLAACGVETFRIVHARLRHAVQSWHFVVERQTDGIEQHTLAGTRGTGDKKDGFALQRCFVEGNSGILQAREVVDNKFLQVH